MTNHEERKSRGFYKDKRSRESFRNNRFNRNNRSESTVEESSKAVDNVDGGEGEVKTNKLYSALKFLVRDVACAVSTDAGYSYDRDRRKLNTDYVMMLNKGLKDIFKDKFEDYKDGGYCGAFAYIMAVCLKEAYLVDTYIIRSFTDDLDADLDTKNIKTIYQLDSLEFPKKLEHTYYGFVLDKVFYVGDAYGIHSENPITNVQGKHKFKLPNGYESKEVIKIDSNDNAVVNYIVNEATFFIKENKVNKESRILLPYEKEILSDLSNEERTPKNYSEIWNSNKFLDSDFGFSFKR